MFKKVFFKSSIFRREHFKNIPFKKIFFSFDPIVFKKFYMPDVLGVSGYGYNYGINYGEGL